MIITFLILIIGNILVFYYKIESTDFFIMMGAVAGFYKGFIVEEKKEIFNTYRVKLKVNKTHFIEFIASILTTLLFFNYEIVALNIKLSDIVLFIMFTLLVYRLYYYNLFERYGKWGTQKNKEII